MLHAYGSVRLQARFLGLQTKGTPLQRSGDVGGGGPLIEPELRRYRGPGAVPLLADVAGQGVGLDLRDAAGLVAEEYRLVLRGEYDRGSLSEDDEGVRVGVKVVDHDVARGPAGCGEKTGLIGQDAYLLVRQIAATTL